MITTENLSGFEQIRVNDKVENILIFKEINKELKEYLSKNDDDSTDDVFDFLKWLSSKCQEEFDKLLEDGRNKKPFIKALTCIFALLLNTKVDTKVKRILKIAVETTLKIWQRLTVRCMPVDVMIRGRLGKQTYPYKIKLPLPE